MIAALSPGLSWLLFGGWLLAVVLIIAFFMGASERRASRAPEGVDFLSTTTAPIDRFRPEFDAPYVRVMGGIYDHEARGDFDG